MKSTKEKFEHLVKILSSERFLNNKILCNSVPFFIADYNIKEQDEAIKLQQQLIKALENKNIKILNINLYDLVIEILKKNNDWDWYIENEATMTKAELKEEFQSILDVTDVITPAITEKANETNYDIMFLSGVGEVFPYMRSHNVLANLEKIMKTKPLLMFFPGEYNYTDSLGTNFKLFNLLPEKREYKAANIYEIKEV